MTTALAGAPPSAATLAATRILDHDHPSVRELAASIAATTDGDRDFLSEAHRRVSVLVHPVYTLGDDRPASETLRAGSGACTQRMAVLEALARAAGIPTRVRGLWIDGRFWSPRFRLTRALIPGRVLLPWPQFHVGGEWVDFDEIHAPAAELAARGDGAFTNDGETMFEAVSHVSVDFLGKTRGCGAACAASRTDLSGMVRGDAGTFDTRDELFARHGLLRRTWRGAAFEVVFGGRKSA